MIMVDITAAICVSLSFLWITPSKCADTPTPTPPPDYVSTIRCDQTVTGAIWALSPTSESWEFTAALESYNTLTFNTCSSQYSFRPRLVINKCDVDNVCISYETLCDPWLSTSAQCNECNSDNTLFTVYHYNFLREASDKLYIQIQSTVSKPTVGTHKITLTCSNSGNPGTTQPTRATIDPTNDPTDTPSNNPSESPTNYPSQYPTKYPTKYPSKFPTSTPTNIPSSTPTSKPTSTPTTSIPTNYPSQYPTKYPTKYPSKFPTSTPTNVPSSTPTTSIPTTFVPTPLIPTTAGPTTSTPTTSIPTTSIPTTSVPTTLNPTTASPTTSIPTTTIPTSAPITKMPTNAPITAFPTTSIPSEFPTSSKQAPVTDATTTADGNRGESYNADTNSFADNYMLIGIIGALGFCVLILFLVICVMKVRQKNEIKSSTKGEVEMKMIKVQSISAVNTMTVTTPNETYESQNTETDYAKEKETVTDSTLPLNVEMDGNDEDGTGSEGNDVEAMYNVGGTMTAQHESDDDSVDAMYKQESGNKTRGE